MKSKPIHILASSPDEKMLAVCELLNARGYPTTCGECANPKAKYVVRMKEGCSGVSAVDIIEAVLSARTAIDGCVSRKDFTVDIVVSEAAPEPPVRMASATPAAPKPAPRPVTRHAVLAPPAGALGEFDPSTALVMMAYGGDERRETAVDKALSELACLNPRPFFFFAELVRPGESVKYVPRWMLDLQDAGQARVILLPLSPCNEHVWQKEPVHNLLGKMAVQENCDVLIFHDPDCYPTDRSWCARVGEYLEKNPRHILQPWGVYSDEREQTHRDVMSYASARDEGFTEIRRAPGLAWAMTPEVFVECDGFNPFFAPGGGDCGWVFSILDDPRMSTQPLTWPWWVEILQSCRKPHYEVHSLPIEMVHCWHGPFAERSYHWRNRALCDITEHVLPELSLDVNGLLKLRRSAVGSAIRHVLANKARMVDEAGCRAVVKEALGVKEHSNG